MFPNSLTRPLAGLTALSIAIVGCSPSKSVLEKPAVNNAASEELIVNKALESVARLKVLLPSTKQPGEAIPVLPPPRLANAGGTPVTIDSYEAFLRLFLSKTGKDYGTFRKELVEIRAKLDEAKTKKQQPPDLSKIEAKLADLKKDEAMHSQTQKDARADTAARIDEFKKAAKIVDTLLNTVTDEITPRIVAAGDALTSTVDAIKEKKLDAAEIQDHLAKEFSPQGSVGKAIAEINEVREAANGVLAGIEPAIKGVAEKAKALNESFERLLAVFPHDPSLKPIVNETREAVKQWFQRVEVIVGALLTSPIGFILIALLNLFGGGVGGGGNEPGGSDKPGGTKSDKPGEGDMSNGAGPTPSKPEDEFPKLPEGAKPVSIKTPDDGPYRLRVYTDGNGDMWLDVVEQKTKIQHKPLPFSIHKYGGFETISAEQTAGKLVLKAMHLAETTYPVTLTVDGSGGEAKIFWADVGQLPRILKRPTSPELKIPESAEPIPTESKDGDTSVLRDEKDLVLVQKNRTLRLPLQGIETMFPIGKPETVILSASIGTSDNPYPVTLLVKHQGEVKQILWDTPGLPPVLQYGSSKSAK